MLAGLKRRDRFELIVCAVIAVASLILAIVLMTVSTEMPIALQAAGFLLLALGAAFVAFVLVRNGRNRGDTVGEILSRQRDRLASVWAWYVLPFVPGLLVIHVAGFMNAGGNRAFRIFAVAITFLVMAAVIWLNARAARRIDESLAALEKKQLVVRNGN